MILSEISIVEWWLIAGVICIIIEFANIQNVGFLFLGLGGVSTAIILNNYPGLLKYQYIIFGFASFMWLITLWYPLKFYVYKKYDNNNRLCMRSTTVESLQIPIPQRHIWTKPIYDV